MLKSKTCTDATKASARRVLSIAQVLLGCACSVLASVVCAGVQAQPSATQAHVTSALLPSAAVLATVGPHTRRVRELDSRIKQAVGRLQTLRLAATPGLDLAAVQLALDCMNESVPCLRAAATKLGVDVLVAPAIEVGHGDLVLSLLYFDARGQGVMTRVVHWQLGEKLAPETLAAVPDLVTGLLPRPAATVASRGNAQATNPRAAAAATVTRDTSKGIPVAPLAILASGAVLLGAGVVTGVLMQGNEHDYAAKNVRTRADAEAAVRAKETASTQATLANIFYGVGAGATLLGGGWLALELFGRGQRETNRPNMARAQLLPTLTPRQVGIVFRQTDDWL